MLEQETSCVFSRTLASLNTRSLCRRHETSGSVSELEVLQSFPPVVFFPCFSFFSPAPVASSLKLQLLPGCRAAKLSCGACAFTVLIQSSSFSVFFYCFFFLLLLPVTSIGEGWNLRRKKPGWGSTNQKLFSQNTRVSMDCTVLNFKKYFDLLKTMTMY